MNEISDKPMKTIIGIVAAVIIVCVCLIPIVNSAAMDHVEYENEGHSDVELSLFKLSSAHADKTVSVAMEGSNIVLSGDYEKTVGNEDQLLMVSNVSSVFVKNGQLYYFDGNYTNAVSQIDLVIAGHNVNGKNADWVYFPETDGIYGSYNDGFDHRVSDVIGVGSFAGYSVVSKQNTVLTDDYLSATVVVDEQTKAVENVHYSLKVKA